MSRTGSSTPLAERWNGERWSITATPRQATAGAQLVNLSCTAATNCVAVGSSAPRVGASKTLAERWNGRNWSILASIDPAGTADYSRFGVVSCTAPTSCLALGVVETGGNSLTDFTERYDGTHWALVADPVPTSSSFSGSLGGLSCASAADCIAVGFYTDNATGGQDRTLVERYDGTRWSVMQSPNPRTASAAT